MHYDGFDLHAGLAVRARRRTVLERVLRYCARPALGHERLVRLADGRVRLMLKTPWADGTTHMIFEPLELIARLTALIPRPHKNLLIYHGVLAPRSRWRSRAVAYGRARASESPQAAATQTDPQSSRRAHRSHWATLMRRAFELDVLACPRCRARLRLIACITQLALVDEDGKAVQRGLRLLEGRFGPNTVVRRRGHEPIFACEKPPEPSRSRKACWLTRLFKQS